MKARAMSITIISMSTDPSSYADFGPYTPGFIKVQYNNVEALAEALQNAEIAAAGLDVLEKEPMEEGDPLLNIQDSSKLIITPHIAWATCEARKRCADEVCENIRCYLQGISRNVVSGGK